MMTSNTIHAYNVLLEEDTPELDISSYIDSIKDFITANTKLDANDSRCNNSFDSSVASRSTVSSENDMEKVGDHRDLFSKIYDKLLDLELILHEEKNNNLINQIKIETELYKIKEDYKNLTVEVDNVSNEMYSIDCRVIETEQYPRRHNLVISGIPDSIRQHDLENKVLDILQAIGVNISNYEVIGCHRLYKPKNSKYPANTIIRFTNRKVVEFCIRNNDRLREVKKNIKMNLRFHENLCQSNEKVFKWCSELKKT